ncbi:MAG: VapE domain-containing protein [Cyanobacteria bacterium J06649_4]
MAPKPFNILEYLQKLNPDGGSHGKHEGSYHCPSCTAKNFKVNLNTGQYSSFGCDCMETPQGRQAVIEVLSPSTWQKPRRPKQRRSWDYKDRDGQPLLQVVRTDDGAGHRQYWQEALQEGEPADLISLAMPYRYHDCLEAIDQSQLIFWVEGEPCAEALWNIGLPATTTIGGTNSYRSEQYRGLFPAESLVICPDRDQPGLKYAEAIATDYPAAQWCYALPDTFLWQRLPKSGGADIADWIEEGATAKAIRDAIGRKRSDVAAFDPNPSIEKATQGKPNRFKRQYDDLAALWGDRLRFNEFTKDIELDETPIDVGAAKVTLAVEENLDISLNNLELMLRHQAKRHAYHPVREYLTHCHAEYQKTEHNPAILTNITERYFGVNDPLYDTYLRRTLIAAVKRAFEPGCKVDTVLILQGPQGYRKSTFFKVLAGPKYFDDSLGSMNDKDERLKLHLVWFCEWPELESVFRRKDIADTKAFLSSSEDLVRPPYGRKTERMPRQSIIVGSTNQEHFLNDPTGNRRFWVIPVKQPINIQQLEKERDHLWGAAMALYLADEQCWLTPAEEQQSEVRAEAYRTCDPWDSRIEAHLLEWRLTSVTTNELLTNCLEIEIGRQIKGHQMRVAECLKRLGWKAARIGSGKNRRRGWVAPSTPAETKGQTLDQPVTERPGRPNGQADSPVVVQPSEPDSQSITDRPDQPGQPIPAKELALTSAPLPKQCIGDQHTCAMNGALEQRPQK